MSLRRLSNSVVMFATLACTGLRAQDIAGQWQGTLKTPGPELRIVLQIAKDGAGWKADLYSIDQTTDPLPATSISLNAGTLKFSVDRVRASYEGKLSVDTNAMPGPSLRAARCPSNLSAPLRRQHG